MSEGSSSNCEYCAYYNVDEDSGLYTCSMELDEDEMVRFLGARHKSCPYFKLYDEYAIVRKQG